MTRSSVSAPATRIIGQIENRAPYGRRPIGFTLHNSLATCEQCSAVYDIVTNPTNVTVEVI